MEPLPSVADDGLHTPEVGDWAEDKYRLVRCYNEIFTGSMKNQWQHRICIDLFSGAGRALLRDSRKIVEASPLLALGVKNPFDQYIFCELDEQRLSALRERIARQHAKKNVQYVIGDSNANVSRILEHIPQHSRTFRVLSFCFADPFNVGNLKFATIKQLAAGRRRIDFLILIPSGMDAQRNYDRDTSESFAGFLGNPDWRDDWEQQRVSGRSFANFFVDEFGKSMQRLGYLWHGVPSTEIIKNEKQSPMYHLAFFSRHELGAEFWKICRQSAAVQTSLF